MINRINDELLVAVGRRPTRAPPVALPTEENAFGEKVKAWAAETEKCIATHPGASLAAALGVGIMVGWWVKRT